MSSEIISRCPVEDAFFLKARERVSRQHLRPFVAVITGRIAACKDVGKTVLETVERVLVYF